MAKRRFDKGAIAVLFRDDPVVACGKGDNSVALSSHVTLDSHFTCGGKCLGKSAKKSLSDKLSVLGLPVALSQICIF